MPPVNRGEAAATAGHGHGCPRHVRARHEYGGGCGGGQHARGRPWNGHLRHGGASSSLLAFSRMNVSALYTVMLLP